MKKIISEGFGCQIIERDGKLFICFDGGHLAVKMTEYEITKEEAKKAMLSERDAYEVILNAQNRNPLFGASM